LSQQQFNLVQQPFKVKASPAVVAHAFHPSTWESEAGGFLSSRTARATQRNPVSKQKQKTKQNRVARASKMAQQVKALAAKSVHSSSNPETHMV
jgi:hypothetical protein